MRSAAVFEEIGIIDLENLIAVTNMDDIWTALGGLLAGSEKHLRTYVNVLAKRKIKYKPQLSQPRGVRPDRLAPISLLFFKNRS